MSAQVSLYVAVIVLFLVALAVITAAALVRRPRREWQVAVMGQTHEIRGSALSDLSLKTVKPRRVSLDEMWATNSVPQSAYVGAPRIPDRSMVAAALAPLERTPVRQNLLRPTHPHPNYEPLEPLIETDWDAPASQHPFTPAPPPTEEDLSNSEMWLQSVYSTLDAEVAPPPMAPPPPTDHYMFEDPFYGQDVENGMVSLTNAGLTRPQFNDEVWEGFVYEPQGRPEDMTFQEAARGALTEMQALGGKISVWGSGVYASARAYLDDRKGPTQGTEEQTPENEE